MAPLGTSEAGLGGAELGTADPPAAAGWASRTGCWRLAEHRAGCTLATRQRGCVEDGSLWWAPNLRPVYDVVSMSKRALQPTS